MTFSKPNVTYTEMCKWIDQHSRQPDCDAEKLFIYIYHIANMLAHKLDYFNTIDMYDKYSLYVASKLYMRLQGPNTAKYDEIKNILDYMKKVVYPMKVDFCKSNLGSEFTEELDVYTLDSQSEFVEYLVDESSLFDNLEFAFAIGDISSIVRAYLVKIPVKRNSAEWQNIYISCMLTLLNSMVPNKIDLAEFAATDLKRNPKAVEKLYTNLRYEKPILFHLDYKYSGYIQVLVTELRHCLASELSWKSSVHVSAATIIKNIISSSAEDDE